MKVLLTGGTGMVGQGVLRECLVDDRVTSVISLGRAAVSQQHPKLRTIVHPDLHDVAPIASQLRGIDAVFFCLGVSAVGMKEPEYRRVTHDLTLGIADAVLEQSGPDTTFIYVSGSGTDSTETGRLMWARVKGETENELERRFTSAYMFRPGLIQPLHGVQSRTLLYNRIYRVAAPLMSVLRRVSASTVVTTEEVGRAMVTVAARDLPPLLRTRKVFGNADIHALAARS